MTRHDSARENVEIRAAFGLLFLYRKHCAGGKDVRTRRDSKDAANLSRKLGERAQILQKKLASYMAMATPF